MKKYSKKTKIKLEKYLKKRVKKAGNSLTSKYILYIITYKWRFDNGRHF